MKNIVILGSTGSIGTQTLEVIRAFPERFSVVGLAAGQNSHLLSQQAQEFRPRFVHSRAPADLTLPSHIQLTGSLEELAACPDADLVVVATSGRVGLLPALAAIRAGKDVAIANKEPLVMAGEILAAEAKSNGVRILPIDSEHSAIWQCLVGEEKSSNTELIGESLSSVGKIILTASGGPFRDFSVKELASVTAQQALHHPTWVMGTKITIDSATLMNKGLEVIEAKWLFNLPLDKIEVLIHRESIIHSMVEFVDGSIKAQMGVPDMRLPIQFALSYPERLPNTRLPRLDWTRIGQLTFQQPDARRFPCLALAREAARRGGTYPAVLCAADEVAVELFLEGQIGFPEIATIVEKALDSHKNNPSPTLDEVLFIDVETRDEIRGLKRG